MDEIRIVIIELIIGFVYLGVYLTVDTVLTHKRLKENQNAWDEYSKDMTWQEREEQYLRWVQRRRIQKRWNRWYFPISQHIKPNVFEIKINGVYFRGTKKEISEKSGIPLDVFESIDRMPLEITTKNITG